MIATRSFVAVRASAFVLLLLLAGCEPKVYELHSGNALERPINILIMGDGFTKAELPSYRAATQRLSQALLTTWPFCQVKQRLNIYRIDVIDPNGGISTGPCTSDCSLSQRIVTDDSFRELATPPAISGFRRICREDFHVTRCQSGGKCDSIWPTNKGIAKIFETARYAPNIEVVIVLANSRVDAGNGHWATFGGSGRLGVVTVPMTESAGAWDITLTGKATFVHELGHALGLIDEYAYGLSETSAVEGDRNVWIATQPGPWTTYEQIPWQRLLPDDCSSSSMQLCCGFFDSGPCEDCSGVPEADCRFVPGICSESSVYCDSPNSSCVSPATCPAPPTNLCPHSLCGEYPSAWEGAAYKAVGNYRSRQVCLMSTLTHGEFCDACALHMWSVVCDPGVPGDCEDPTAILTAGCP